MGTLASICQVWGAGCGAGGQYARKWSSSALRWGCWWLSASSMLGQVVCSIDSDCCRCCQDAVGVKKKKTYLLLLIVIAGGAGCSRCCCWGGHHRCCCCHHCRCQRLGYCWPPPPLLMLRVVVVGIISGRLWTMWWGGAYHCCHWHWGWWWLGASVVDCGQRDVGVPTASISIAVVVVARSGGGHLALRGSWTWKILEVLWLHKHNTSRIF